MYAKVGKSKQNTGRAVANAVSRKKNNSNKGGYFVDNRPQTVVQKIQRKSLTIQAKWHRIQSGGKVRNLNLKDNGDGTWTHTATNTNFKDKGVKDSDGNPLLQQIGTSTSTSATTPSSSSSHNAQNVLFRVMSSGKIDYLPNTPQHRLNNAGKFLEMSPEDFSVFKAGGKRTPSNKVMDPVDLKRYAFDETGQKFYHWDKSKASGHGSALSQSENQTMIDRLKKKELVDRRRIDRTSHSLQPFDVGTYKSKALLPETVNPLSGQSAWTSKGTDVNRDHVPSGESLKRRDNNEAYNQGITIAIPNPEMHRKFSPTFGGRQTSKDQISGKKRQRVEIDADNPQLAIFRDTKHMLDKTRDQDFSGSHLLMNLTKPSNRLRQIGGYRRLNRLNVKTYKKSAKRGYNPGAQGFDYTFDGKGFSYFSQSGLTQGDMMSSLFEEELQKTKKVKRL